MSTPLHSMHLIHYQPEYQEPMLALHRSAIEGLERKAFQSGIRTLCLDTARRRPLTLEFYRKHGYQESGQSFYGAVETVQFSKTLDDRVCENAI